MQAANQCGVARFSVRDAVGGSQRLWEHRSYLCFIPSLVASCSVGKTRYASASGVRRRLNLIIIRYESAAARLLSASRVTFSPATAWSCWMKPWPFVWS